MVELISFRAMVFLVGFFYCSVSTVAAAALPGPSPLILASSEASGTSLQDVGRVSVPNTSVGVEGVHGAHQFGSSHPKAPVKPFFGLAQAAELINIEDEEVASPSVVWAAFAMMLLIAFRRT